MRKILTLMLMVFVAVALTGCKVTIRYRMSGAVTEGVKTLSVAYFQNRASLVQPGLSQNLTDALIDICKSQTNLSIVSSGGDVSFEGDIVDYKTQPLTVDANSEQAAMNRFTITVRVRFTNNVNQDLSYEQSFSRYQDYGSDSELSAVESQLSEEIIKMLVDDIFNKAFVNW